MEKNYHRPRQILPLAFFIFILFHVFWGTADGQCSGTPEELTFSYNTIIATTPGYDTGYTQNLDCEWLFKTTITGETILYRFADMYIDCGDGISSYDGTSSSAASLQSDKCNTAGGSVTASQTTGPNLFIKFTSDGTSNSNEKGTKIEAVAGKDYSQCSSSSSTPIQLMSSETETPLSSPNFPSAYRTDENCTWVITASTSSATITINFKFLEIDQFSGCVSTITVYDGTTLLETFCSALDFSPTKTFTSTAGNTLTIILAAGNYGTRGFLAVYSESGTTDTESSEVEKPSCPQDTCVTPIATVFSVGGATAITGAAFFTYKKFFVLKKKIIPKVEPTNTETV